MPKILLVRGIALDVMNAMNVFSVLGKYKDLCCSRFGCYEVPSWPTASFSPVFLKPNFKLQESDINEIDVYFKKILPINLAVKQIPYFLLLPSSLESNRALVERCGWKIDSTPLSVNLIHERTPFSLPKNISLKVFRFDEAFTDYAYLLEEGFKADKNYLDNVNRLFSTVSADSFVTLLQNSEGKYIGGGTVSVRNRYGFLTWGTISKQYRNCGYHQFLLLGCKMIADSYNVLFCGYATRNAHILNKCDQSFSMFICRKECV